MKTLLCAILFAAAASAQQPTNCQTEDTLQVCTSVDLMNQRATIAVRTSRVAVPASHGHFGNPPVDSFTVTVVYKNQYQTATQTTTLQALPGSWPAVPYSYWTVRLDGIESLMSVSVIENAPAVNFTIVP